MRRAGVALVNVFRCRMSYIVVSSLNTHLTKLHFLLKAYVVSRLVENEVKNRRYHRLCCHLSSKPLFKNVKQLDGCALWCSHWTLIRVAEFGFHCDDNSPCTAKHRAAGKYYFRKRGDRRSFIQCADNDLQCWTMLCAGKTKWNVMMRTCT